MRRLVCSSPEAALLSLSEVIGIAPGELLERICNCRTDLVLANDELESRPFEEVLVRRVLGHWPDALVVPDETVWFHGTRLPRETDFEKGLLPLKDTLSNLTDIVTGLARTIGVPERQCGRDQDAGNLANKLLYLDKVGPYGSLLRATVAEPTGAHCDFLYAPEIVIDLAQSIAGLRAAEVLDLYRSQTSACIVCFLGRERRDDVSVRSLAYIHDAFGDNDDPGFWNTCFNGGGHRVDPADLIHIEWLDG